MISKSYLKQPSEQETIKIDWSKRATSLVVSGYSVSSVAVAVFDAEGTNVSDDMVEGSPSFAGTDIYATFKAGEDGLDYDARFTVTLQKGGSADQIQEEDLRIVVRLVG